MPSAGGSGMAIVGGVRAADEPPPSLGEPMPEQEETSDFVPTMLSFIRWYFRTLDPKFVEQVLAGRPLEKGASELFGTIAADVRGNRGPDLRLTAGDYGRIMDRVAALHLRTRYGEEAVNLGGGE